MKFNVSVFNSGIILGAHLISGEYTLNCTELIENLVVSVFH